MGNSRYYASAGDVIGRGFSVFNGLSQRSDSSTMFRPYLRCFSIYIFEPTISILFFLTIIGILPNARHISITKPVERFATSPHFLYRIFDGSDCGVCTVPLPRDNEVPSTSKKRCLLITTQNKPAESGLLESHKRPCDIVHIYIPEQQRPRTSRLTDVCFVECPRSEGVGGEHI